MNRKLWKWTKNLPRNCELYILLTFYLTFVSNRWSNCLWIYQVLTALSTRRLRIIPLCFSVLHTTKSCYSGNGASCCCAFSTVRNAYYFFTPVNVVEFMFSYFTLDDFFSHNKCLYNCKVLSNFEKKFITVATFLLFKKLGVLYVYIFFCNLLFSRICFFSH